MKFHLTPTTANVVTGFGVGWVRVGAQEYRESVIVTPDSVVAWAPDGFDALEEPDFNALLASKPEVVILGTGRAIRFPHPRLSRSLAEAQVGLKSWTPLPRAAPTTFSPPRAGASPRRC